MFFLKCLDDDSEVDGLIRREIAARDWFIFCESENSRASRWVQGEIQIVRSLEGKVFETVDLSAQLMTQIQQATPLIKRATVFLSYHISDRSIADQMAASLRQHDYGVFVHHQDLHAGENWAERLGAELENAARSGFVLVLLTERALASNWLRYELTAALQLVAARGNSTNIVPILLPGLEQKALSALVELGIETLQAADFRAGTISENMERLIADLKTRQMS